MSKVDQLTAAQTWNEVTEELRILINFSSEENEEVSYSNYLIYYLVTNWTQAGNYPKNSGIRFSELEKWVEGKF